MLTFRRSVLSSWTIGSAISLSDAFSVVAPIPTYTRDQGSIPANSWLGCFFTTASHKRAEGLGGISSGPAEIFDR